MDILIIYLLVAVTIAFLIACSVGLIFLGGMIDDYPVENEKPRERSLASPREATRIAVIASWIMTIPGVYLVIQPETVSFVVGLVVLIGMVWFIGTVFIFSFATLKKLSGKGKEDEVKKSHVRDYPLHTIPKIQKYPRDNQ
jgi:hypothetical protein